MAYISSKEFKALLDEVVKMLEFISMDNLKKICIAL